MTTSKNNDQSQMFGSHLYLCFFVSLGTSAKLLPYSVRSAHSDDVMHTIPETREAKIPPTSLPTILMHQEPILEPESDRKPGFKHMSSPTSSDSLLSLNDVDFGMEEQSAGPSVEVQAERPAIDVDEPDTDRPDTDLADTRRPDTDLPDTRRPDTDLPDAKRPNTAEKQEKKIKV